MRPAREKPNFQKPPGKWRQRAPGSRDGLTMASALILRNVGQNGGGRPAPLIGRTPHDSPEYSFFQT
jgi:hypothetical protein